ncbi:hypothetical protein L1987_89012 [Smallanthus sonchifolius]|nr:hypothetical protein L1987_89012 [Smallanthus sonchifolius]
MMKALLSPSRRKEEWPFLLPSVETEIEDWAFSLFYREAAGVNSVSSSSPWIDMPQVVAVSPLKAMFHFYSKLLQPLIKEKGHKECSEVILLRVDAAGRILLQKCTGLMLSLSKRCCNLQSSFIERFLSSAFYENCYVTTGYTLPHVSLFIFSVLGHKYSTYYDMNRQSLPTSQLFQSDPKNEKEIKSQWI